MRGPARYSFTVRHQAKTVRSEAAATLAVASRCDGAVPDPLGATMVWSLRCTLRLVLAAGVLAATRAAADSSIRCDGGIVQVGDTRLDLLDKCGRPALLEQVTGDRTLVELIDGQAAAMTGVGAERWTYNFGSGQFIRVVTLDFGNVVAIHRGGYGYPPELLRDLGPGRARCDSAAIRVGDSKLDLLARCGGPAAREFRREKRPVSLPGVVTPGPAFASVDVEAWTYDFGPQAFRSIVTLEDGRVVLVERGNYGTAR